MKKILAVLSLVLMFGCSDDKQKLYVYNWADYIDPDVISMFEEKYNCNVIIDQFDDNEAMLAKLLVGSSGYDVIFPSSYTIEVLKNKNLIVSLDMSKLYNVTNNFDMKYSKLTSDDTLKFSVPYAFSMTGICYRKDKIKNNNSWNLFFDKSCKNRVCILNDIREIIGIGLKYNGYSVNSTNKDELNKALSTMIKFKQHANKLDNIQYKSGIINGEFYICMGYNSDILQITAENEHTNLGFFIPNEGSTCCFDEICILKDSKNIELAYQFINFLYEDEISAKNSKYICAVMPNKNMWKFLSEDEINNELFNIPTNTLNRLESIKNIGKNLKLYNDTWDKFKASK